MKSAIKAVQYKLFKFVQAQALDAKRGIAMGKAKKEISMFHMFDKRLGSFHGRELIQDDTVVQAITGAYSYEPNAAFVGDRIIINTAFASIPAEYQEAVFFHELAHIELKHQKNPLLYMIQSRLGFGYGLQMEYEADEYSAMKGAKMLEALEFLLDAVPASNNRANNLRLKRLRSICNV